MTKKKEPLPEPECVVCGTGLSLIRPFRPNRLACPGWCSRMRLMKKSDEYRREHRKPPIRKACAVCGTAFETQNANYACCTPACGKKRQDHLLAAYRPSPEQIAEWNAEKSEHRRHRRQMKLLAQGNALMDMARNDGVLA